MCVLYIYIYIAKGKLDYTLAMVLYQISLIMGTFAHYHQICFLMCMLHGICVASALSILSGSPQVNESVLGSTRFYPFLILLVNSIPQAESKLHSLVDSALILRDAKNAIPVIVHKFCACVIPVWIATRTGCPVNLEADVCVYAQ